MSQSQLEILKTSPNRINCGSISSPNSPQPLVCITKVEVPISISSPNNSKTHTQSSELSVNQKNTDFSIENLLRKDKNIKYEVIKISPASIAKASSAEELYFKSPSASDETLHSSEEEDYEEEEEFNNGSDEDKKRNGNSNNSLESRLQLKKRKKLIDVDHEEDEDDDEDTAGATAMEGERRSFDESNEYDYDDGHNNKDEEHDTFYNRHRSLNKNFEYETQPQRLLSHSKFLTPEEKANLSTFSWLTCTRFKPPKLPRSSKKRSGCKRYGRGPRIPFAPHQIAVLESTFAKSQYLSSDCIHRLADTLHLSETRVKIWFQNRRARFRREKEPQLGTASTLQFQQSNSHHHQQLRNANFMRVNQHQLFSHPENLIRGPGGGDMSPKHDIGNTSPLSSSGGSDVIQSEIDNGYLNQLKSRRNEGTASSAAELTQQQRFQHHSQRLLMPDIFSFQFRQQQQQLQQYYLEQQKFSNGSSNNHSDSAAAAATNNNGLHQGNHGSVVSTSPLLHSALQQPPILPSPFNTDNIRNPDDKQHALTAVQQQQFHNFLYNSQNFPFPSTIPTLPSTMQLPYNPVRFT